MVLFASLRLRWWLFRPWLVCSSALSTRSVLAKETRTSNANFFDMVSARCRDNDTSTRINSHQFVCLFSSPAHSCTAAPLNFDWKRKDRAFIPSSLVSGHKVRHLWCKLVVARFRLISILATFLPFQMAYNRYSKIGEPLSN